MKPKPRKVGQVRPARRAVVLLAVLIAITLLSLAAYQYSDLMTSEYKAADNAHRGAQAHAYAVSGIQFAAGVLANPDYVNNQLHGNIWNNDLFHEQNWTIDENLGIKGRFTLIAPPDALTNTSGIRFGVVDEGAKININVLMQLDPSGNRLYSALMTLPKMDPGIAAAIVDWVDKDSTPRDGGAEDDYYMGLNPPYHCKNGPLESLEELLLVKGMTWDKLFGRDKNRNGVIDGDESSVAADLDFGWAPYLTVYSRESNSDAYGNPFYNLNDSDIQTLYQNLSDKVDEKFAKFVILVRQYGDATAQAIQQQQQQAAAAAAAANNPSTPSTTTPSTTTPSTTTGGKTTTPSTTTGGKTTTPSTTTGGKTTTPSTTTPAPTTPNPSVNVVVVGDVSSLTIDFTKKATNKINSLWQLVSATVQMPATQPNFPPTTYPSPLADLSTQRTLLPKVFALTTVLGGNEIPARINVNTAPVEVLNSVPELSDDDITKILGARQSASGDPIFQTPAWLLTEAKLDPLMLQQAEPYITTKSQVYRVQSVGYLDEGGAAARIEAIIDTNGGRPRILMWRDLTPLGRGWNNTGD